MNESLSLYEFLGIITGIAIGAWGLSGKRHTFAYYLGLAVFISSVAALTAVNVVRAVTGP